MKQTIILCLYLCCIGITGRLISVCCGDVDAVGELRYSRRRRRRRDVTAAAGARNVSDDDDVTADVTAMTSSDDVVTVTTSSHLSAADADVRRLAVEPVDRSPPPGDAKRNRLSELGEFTMTSGLVLSTRGSRVFIGKI